MPLEDRKTRCVILTAPSGVSARDAAEKIQQYAKEQAHHEIAIVKVEAGLAEHHAAYLRQLEGNPKYKARQGPRFVADLQDEWDSLDEQIYLHFLLAKPKEYLTRLWREAARGQLNAAPRNQDLMVILHSVYYHTELEDFVSCVDVDVLRDWATQWNTEITRVVTLIDDVDDALQRLTVPGALWDDPGQPKPEGMPIGEWEEQRRQRIIRQMFNHLVVWLNWRRAEAFMAAELADELGANKHILLATKHHRAVAHKILFPSADTNSVYLSHPISQPRRILRDPGGRDPVRSKVREESARTLMRQVQELTAALLNVSEMPAFAPTTIDELRFVDLALDERWEYPGPGSLLYAPPPAGGVSAAATMQGFEEEDWARQRPLLQNLAAQINAQIKSRDRKLVEQVKAILVWRPYFDGKLAGGVLEEIEHRNHLVRYGVRRPDEVRCFIMNPKSDLIHYRLNTLLQRLRKELVMPATGAYPTVLDSLQDEPPNELLAALEAGRLPIKVLRQLVDPNHRCIFRDINVTTSTMAGEDSLILEEATRAAWSRVAGEAARLDELSDYLMEGDLTYPYDDIDTAGFVKWASAQF